MAANAPQAGAGDSSDKSDIPAPPRGLKAAVIIMGILLVVGFIVVFGTIIYRVVNSGDGGGTASQPRGVFGAVEVPLPAGATIVSTEVDADRALVRIRTGNGVESLIVLDLRRGHELGRFQLGVE